MDLNLMSKLWKKISNNVLSCAQLFEFMKLAGLDVVQIMGFVENERTFSTLTFMKIRLQNHLLKQDYEIVCLKIWILDLVVQMFT